MPNSKPIPKKQVISQRHAFIIDELSKKPTTKKEFEKAGINSSTLKGDLRTLRELGYKISSQKGTLTLTASDVSSLDYSSITSRDMIKFFVLAIINHSAQDYPTIRNQINVCVDSGTTKTDIVSEYLLRIVMQELREESLISYERVTNTYTNTSKYRFIPIDPEDVFNYSSFCLSKPKKFNLLHKKINHYFISDLLRSRSATSLSKLEFYLTELQKLNYTEDAISFYYSSTKGNKIKYNYFHIGLIAYEKDKDIVYLLGRNRPTKSSYLMLRADKIHWNNSDETNDIYRMEKAAQQINPAEKKEYLEKFRSAFIDIKHEMFDISENAPEKVSVQFDYHPSILEQVQQLAYMRKKASLFYVSNQNKTYTDMRTIPKTETIEKIIYTDTIRGLGDFANFLRRFGNKALVLENNTLKKQMLNTALQTLNAYKKGEIDAEYEQYNK